MTGRIVAALRTLTRGEWSLAIWVVLAPVVLGIALILGDGVAAWLGVMIFVVYYVVALGGLGLLLWRRVRRRAAPPVTTPPDRGLLADVAPAWAPQNSSWLGERSLVRRVAEDRGDELLAIGSRTRSEWMREPLAHVASRGRFDYRTLARLFERGADSSAELLLAGLDLRGLFALGRLVASQDSSPRDAEVSLGMMLRVATHPGFGTLGKRDRLYVAERLVFGGRLAEALPIVASEEADFAVRALQADLLNPFEAPGAGLLNSSETLWLAAFNGLFAPVGLEPVSLLPGAGVRAFDRLDAVAEETHDGPLISVVMSCYRPSESMLTAIRSVIAQTWQNWELLVADDASPVEFGPLLDRAAAMDPRIRVLRATENRGTYVRRDEAIVAARGDFVTMHDSDDWAHPRRLELQAAQLVAHPEEVAGLTESVRVSETLRFSQPRRVMLRQTETSLMFRRHQVIERIGFFDSVRKAADAEFRERLELAFGRAVPVLRIQAPLVLMGFSTRSLSGEEFGDGWSHPARSAYREARAGWHGRIRSGAADARLAFPLTARPFTAPRRFLEPAPSPRDLDLVLVLDARSRRSDPKRVDAVAAELRSLARTGTVGLLHLESLDTGRTPAIDPRFQELIDDGIIENVLPDEQVRATVVAVYDTGVMQLAPSTSAVTTGRTVLLGTVEESLATRTDVERAAARLFGARPEWVPVRPLSFSL